MLVGLLLPFLAFETSGSALWVGVGLALGWLFPPAVNDMLTTLGQMGRWGLMLLGGLLALFVAIRALRRHRFRVRLRMDRISVDALDDMLAKGEPVANPVAMPAAVL